jgi:hypothetical protein
MNECYYAGCYKVGLFKPRISNSYLEIFAIQTGKSQNLFLSFVKKRETKLRQIFNYYKIQSSSF